MLCLILMACSAELLDAQETRRQYLSGLGKDDAVAWKFYCTAGRNAGRWTTIPVPSNWELQGFGTFNYGYELGKAPVRAGAAQGRYRRTFKVPAGWSALRVFLVFDGAMTDTEVRVNGQPAGPKHQGGFYPFRY